MENIVQSLGHSKLTGTYAEVWKDADGIVAELWIGLFAIHKFL